MIASLNLFSFNPPHDYCLNLFSFSYRNMKDKHRTKLKRELQNPDLEPNPPFLGRIRIPRKSPTPTRVCQFAQKPALPKNHRIWSPKRVLQLPLKKYFTLNLDVYFTYLLSYRRKPFRSMGYNREDKSREFYPRTDH